jgi:hypothetical protein
VCLESCSVGDTISIYSASTLLEGDLHTSFGIDGSRCSRKDQSGQNINDSEVHCRISSLCTDTGRGLETKHFWTRQNRSRSFGYMLVMGQSQSIVLAQRLSSATADVDDGLPLLAEPP